jgi:hypothetical protein
MLLQRKKKQDNKIINISNSRERYLPKLMNCYLKGKTLLQVAPYHLTLDNQMLPSTIESIGNYKRRLAEITLI